MRGMDSNIIGDARTLAKYFDLQDHEAEKLKNSVLPWLHSNNVWYQAYRSSYRQVKDFESIVKQHPDSGYLLPVLPSTVTTHSADAPHKGFIEDFLVVLIPT